MPDTEALAEPKMPEPTMTCSRCGEAFNLPWLQPGQTWQHCDGGAMIKAGPSDTEALAEPLAGITDAIQAADEFLNVARKHQIGRAHV